MLNYKRLVPRTLSTSAYAHNNEKLTDGEADKINDGSFVEDATSVNGECVTAQEVNQKLSQENKHVNYMVGGDDTNELVCYYTWSTDTIEPTSVYIPNLSLTVEDRKLLAYEITPSNADVTSAEFSITSGSDIAHIDDSYVVADAEGAATYKVVINGSIEATATITVSNKPEEFPDDAEHRWIEVEPKTSTIPASGGTINVTGSYGLTGTYGTKKKVGDISDTITIEANTETETKSGSKTYYYNNNQFDTPTADITWTQEAHVENYTYRYEIYVGENIDMIQDSTLSFVWESNQFGESSKNVFYVNSVKYKINEAGNTVGSEIAPFIIKASSETFASTINDSSITVYPFAGNTSLTDNKTSSIIVAIEEHQQSYCTIQLIQTKTGVKVIAGDAVMFTYNWEKGTDLDQATTVNVNAPVTNPDRNYAGFLGNPYAPYNQFLHFAGDNTGTGNEYSFIDFKSIAQYLTENGTNNSTVDGKTIIESLMDQNGVISVECDLYTNWYNRKEIEDITLSYQVYTKTSDDASVSANSDKTFTITGYTESSSSSSSAKCFAYGTLNPANGAINTYTLSAKFIYYFNSGVFTFETNKDDVAKWQKGIEWTYQELSIVPTINSSTISQDDTNVTMTATLESLNLPSSITAEKVTAQFGPYAIGNSMISLYNAYDVSTTPVDMSNTVAISVLKNKLSAGTHDIYPCMCVNAIFDNNTHIIYSINDVVDTDHKITITV